MKGKNKKKRVPAGKPSPVDAIRSMLSKGGQLTGREESDLEKYAWKSISDGKHGQLRTMLSHVTKTERTVAAEAILDSLISTVRVSADNGRSECAFWGFGVSITIFVHDERWRPHLEKPFLEISPTLHQLLVEKTFSRASGLALLEGQHGTVLPLLLVGESVTTISDGEWRELLESVVGAALDPSGKLPVLPASFRGGPPKPWHVKPYGFASCLTMLGMVMSRGRGATAQFVETDGTWAKNLREALKDGLEKEVAPVARITVLPMAGAICTMGDLVRLRKQMLVQQTKNPRWEPFYTFNEWRRRYARELAGVEPESVAAHYSAFLKRWYANAIALEAEGHFVMVVKVETDEMRDYIDRNHLDESDEQAWSEAARETGLPVLEPIIEVVDENPEVVPKDVVATITYHSVNGKMITYMLAQIHTPEKEVVATYAAWNALVIPPGQIEKVLTERLREKGVRELRFWQEGRPVEVCPYSGRLVGPLADGPAEDVGTA